MEFVHKVTRYGFAQHNWLKTGYGNGAKENQYLQLWNYCNVELLCQTPAVFLTRCQF